MVTVTKARISSLQLEDTLNSPPENFKEMKKNPTSILEEYCEASTCAGVIDWHFSKRKVSKSFWLFCVLLGLCATAYQMATMIMDYWNNGKGNFQSTIRRVPMDKDFLFPAVTVCNFNRVMKSKLERDKVDPMVIEYAFGAIPVNYDFPMRAFKDIAGWRDSLPMYEEAWRNYSNGTQPDVGQMLWRYGYSWKQMIINSGRFNGGGYMDMESMVEEVVTSYGLCARIKVNKTQTRPGNIL